MDKDSDIDLYFPELFITFSYFQNASELFPSYVLQYYQQNKKTWNMVLTSLSIWVKMYITNEI